MSLHTSHELNLVPFQPVSQTRKPTSATPINSCCNSLCRHSWNGSRGCR